MEVTFLESPVTKPSIDPKFAGKVLAKFAAKSAGKAGKGKKFVTGLVLGGTITGTGLTTLSQTRKPPTLKAIKSARGMAPFLIRSF